MDEMLREIVASPANICFCCGPGNPVGLQLRVEQTDGRVWATFEPDRWHQGWVGVVHGGVLASVLDEVMAYCLFYQGIKAVTARMEIRYRSAAYRGEQLLAEARLVQDRRKVVDVEGRICRGEVPVVEAAGRFMKLGLLDPAELLSTASIS